MKVINKNTTCDIFVLLVVQYYCNKRILEYQLLKNSKFQKLKRSLYQMPVVAITGSVGKTSTKDMVANVISKKYKTLKTIR